MNRAQIEHIIDRRMTANGLVDTGIQGVQLFKVTEPIQCAPAVYEPSVTAIVSGGKEAIWGGHKHTYDNSKYICCSVSMPIETGTPETTPEHPLVGVYIALDTRLMTELALEIESNRSTSRKLKSAGTPQGVTTAAWDEEFTDALYRLLSLDEHSMDLAILGKSRLRELYYAILKGEAGNAFTRAFGVGNEIARSIEFLSSHLTETLTIDDLADQIGMSRAVFHRKFKQATNMSPIQFVKSMRLNHAAMKIAEGTNVNVAALDVGYVSSSQFSREFKRMYGLSPKQWVQTKAASLDTA
ncbi:MAG: AraC family transcriptional regulator [Alteromonadaceae bacterium]|jgi:AraC-like DNA-binding protein|nr:AraC family transcriptional regulator [Alteromonadaceae bacterium]MBB18068.1 AraC family transcriptional regulator [Rickettsiales bacterium]